MLTRIAPWKCQRCGHVYESIDPIPALSLDRAVVDQRSVDEVKETLRRIGVPLPAADMLAAYCVASVERLQSRELVCFCDKCFDGCFSEQDGAGKG